MNLQQEINIAKQIALEAHSQQEHEGKNGKTPYMVHVQAVVDAVSDEAKPAAYVHDVMEDHQDRFTPEILRDRGLSEETVHAARLLNKHEHPELSYEGYVKLLANNKVAREVKIADIRHNLSCVPTEEQKIKYAKALKILESA